RARRDDARIRYLLKTDMPFVVMGRSDVKGDYCYVDGDGTLAFYSATQRLLDLGHQRILHLAAPSTFTFATLRRDGYVKCMLEAGQFPLVQECAAEIDASYKLALEVLTSDVRPTAIICATDRMAFGVLKAARQLGIEIPKELSIIGHDNLPASLSSEPALTTMELSPSETGHRLANILLEAIKNPQGHKEHAILPVHFIERETTAAPSAHIM
ncbi:MAG: LacI family transcriptional regulator, partial [Methylocystaceae bacterium]|nr:LacI family transcriptional regulator [Methylocystaceae bacterium]